MWMFLVSAEQLLFHGRRFILQTTLRTALQGVRKFQQEFSVTYVVCFPDLEAFWCDFLVVLFYL